MSFWTKLLINASENGHRKVVQALLKMGVDVNAKNKDGWTALMVASFNGHLEVMQALLAKGADINAKRNYGGTALITAIAFGRLDVVQALLAKGADVNAKENYGETALMRASQKGYLDVVQALLAKGADVNAKNKDGETALMFAAANGHLDVVRALLAQGADVNAKTNDGRTALMLASQNGHLAVVQALLAKGADVNAKTGKGNTALIKASENGHLDVVELLRRQSGGDETQPAHAFKSDYWKCPKCGGILQKGVGRMFAETIGIATCGGCGAKFNQSDVYGGKYDVEERTAEPVYKFRIIGSTAMWGQGHQITFNNEYTSTELSWLLDGTLFPVSSTMTEAECRELVEGNFPAAFQIALRSSQQFNLPKPEASDGYTLAITKLHLSYAVRNNVALAEAVRIFKTTMGYK
jgi:ankyrin repeat protein